RSSSSCRSSPRRVVPRGSSRGRRAGEAGDAAVQGPACAGLVVVDLPLDDSGAGGSDQERQRSVVVVLLVLAAPSVAAALRGRSEGGHQGRGQGLPVGRFHLAVGDQL